MKIAILTLPLHNNYGGILQAYALQKTLMSLGHETWLLHLQNPRDSSITLWLINYANKILKLVAGTEIKFTGRETGKFVKKYFPNKSPRFLSADALNKYIVSKGIEGIVVGSDQVWRPQYGFNVRNFFLDFCENNHSINRLAYAASFGVDEWQFTDEETIDCKRLATLFDFISVREYSGVDLCRRHLNVAATVALDPTMLLGKDEYIKLIKEWKEPKSSGDLFYYMLDQSDCKMAFINRISAQTDLTPFSVYPRLPSSIKNYIKSPKDCTFPRVTQWLRAFQDAQMVVTDSFHGCVFSIIFNVPFWVVGNASRGNARFDSLLKLFHLENRLIDVSTEIIDYNEPIDWETVNRIRTEMIVKSKAAFNVF